MDIEYFHELEQGSPEWHEIRLGIVTASEMNNLVTPTGKKASGKAVQAYASEIVSQRINRCIEDSYQSYAMMKGHFLEDHARQKYDENYNAVKQCGFITRDFDGFTIGCSPDGLVGDDGLIEIKSRMPKFHVEVVRSKKVPAEYVNQCQTALLVSGRDWIDFVHYCPGMKLFVEKVEVDKERRQMIINATKEFELLVQETEAIYAESSAKMVMTERVEFEMDGMIKESEEGE